MKEKQQFMLEAAHNTPNGNEYKSKKLSAENRRELNERMIKLASLEKRNNELNALFRRLYEDNVLGKVTNEQFPYTQLISL